MRRIIITILNLILVWNMCVFSCFGSDLNQKKSIYLQEEIPNELKNLYAQSAVLMDADSGRILFGKNENKIMPMASTTKIMTCILVLENADLKDKAIVSQYAAEQPAVKLNVSQGEEYYIEDLLYSLMLESHNDTAVVLAEHVAGNVKSFAKLMNEKAKEIGCNSTYFITPNGLDAVDNNGIHSTTAADLARILRYCINVSDKNKEFVKITRTKEYLFQNAAKTKTYSCTNHNSFLNMMDGALTGKTGFTTKAGYCYVGALKKGKEKYIVALLACGWPNNKGYKWSDTKKLMEYGLENYSYQKIIINNEISDVAVGNAMPVNWEKVVKVKIKPVEKEVSLILKKDDDVKVLINLNKDAAAPIKAGTKAGEIRYCVNDICVYTRNMYYAQDINIKKIFGCFLKVSKKILVI